MIGREFWLVVLAIALCIVIGMLLADQDRS